MKKYYNILFFILTFAIQSCSPPSFEESFKEKTEEFLKSHNYINGAYRVDFGDKLLVDGAQGYFDIDSKVKLDKNQKMPIASGTKQMTASIILKLHERGMLTLYDKITKFLPASSGFWPNNEVPAWADEVNIHMLLTHTSGLAEYIPALKFDMNKPHLEINKEISKFAATSETTGAPGEKYNYSNTNYVYLGLIIETLLEKDLASIFKAEIFDPLNMNDTHMSDISEAIAFQKNQLKDFPSRYFAIPTGGSPKVIPANVDFFLIPFADGGVVSTVNDLIKWNKAFHNGNVVNENSYKLMTTPYAEAHDIFHKRVNIGYGVYIAELESGHKAFYHSGRAVGIRSEHGYIPDADIYFAMLSNVMTYEMPEMAGKVEYSDINNQFDIAFLRSLFWNLSNNKLSN